MRLVFILTTWFLGCIASGTLGSLTTEGPRNDKQEITSKFSNFSGNKSHSLASIHTERVCVVIDAKLTRGELVFEIVDSKGKALWKSGVVDRRCAAILVLPVASNEQYRLQIKGSNAQGTYQCYWIEQQPKEKKETVE